MPYIGSFKLNSNNWIKLEDLIKETLSDFAFDVNRKYQMQTVDDDIRVIESDKEPTSNDKGFWVENREIFTYSPTSGYSLYVKSNTAGQFINIGEK